MFEATYFERRRELQCKISDFGLAKDEPECKNTSHNYNSMLHRFGAKFWNQTANNSPTHVWSK
ncbi:hypothetical protein MTR_4g079585 [Medicago truncatula]|uniref:Uncharacterized protein n=1 Tax=Medicago truncatula TaxID=3880 RepID=A0A072UNV8_MEDTR|nr:hypothetical protein MTR_4g079585 [Medicago truncatula]